MNYYNPNKAVSATQRGINVHYTDSLKSHNIYYDERSSLKELQVSGTVNVQVITKPELNETQKELYNLAMYGIKTLTDEQVKSLSYTKKLRIITTFEDAQIKINVWKQELIHSKLGSILTSIFSKSDLVKDLCSYPKAINTWEPCTITLKELNIKKEQTYG